MTVIDEWDAFQAAAQDLFTKAPDRVRCGVVADCARNYVAHVAAISNGNRTEDALLSWTACRLDLL